MSARGVHFAISPKHLEQLLEAADDDVRMEVMEEVEEEWEAGFVAESDKAWDAIHRCLTYGRLLYENGEYPLNLVVCGGRQLIEGDEFTISLVTGEQVKNVADALQPLSEEWMRDRYFSLLKPEDYGSEIGNEDFDYTWEWFQEIRRLYVAAALSGRAVVFTVDA